MFRDCATIQRPSRTSDGQGGYIQTLVTVGSYRARYASPTGKDVAYAGAMQDHVDAVVYFPPDTDVLVEDRITVRGETYIALPQVSPSVPAYVKVMVRRVKR